jgi:hypothetical protein
MRTLDSGLASPTEMSRRGFLVVGGVVTATMATGFERAAAAHPATSAQVDLNFESGSLGPPITSYRGATAAAAYAHSGTYGCRLAPTYANGNIACLVVDRSGFALYKPYATYTMFFRLATLPKATDTYMNLFEIGNTSTASDKSQFTMFFRDNRLVCDFAWHETMDIAAVPSTGVWHLVQAIVYYGATTYTAYVSYDGGATKKLTSANNKTAQSVRALWIHYPAVAVDYIVDVDDAQMSTSDTMPGYLGPGPSSGRHAA